MGALAAVIWFTIGMGCTVAAAGSVPESDSAGSAQKDKSSPSLRKDRSWSPGTVLSAVAAGVCFLEAAAHSAEVINSGYRMLRSPVILKNVCQSVQTDLAATSSQTM